MGGKGQKSKQRTSGDARKAKALPGREALWLLSAAPLSESGVEGTSGRHAPGEESGARRGRSDRNNGE